MNDPEGVRILSSAGRNLFKPSALGFSAFEAAGAFGSLQVLEELVVQAGPDLSKVRN